MSASWNGKTETGEATASGTYFYTLKAENYVSTQKMIILKWVGLFISVRLNDGQIIQEAYLLAKFGKYPQMSGLFFFCGWEVKLGFWPV